VPTRTLLWFLPAALVPWVPIDDRASPQPGWCLHVEGHFAWMDKDHALAARRYEAALTADPDALNTRYWLAQAHHELGRYDQAADALGPVLAAFPTSYPALMLMSRIQDKRRDYAEAARMAGRAYRVPGLRTNTGVRWIKLMLKAGDRAGAQAAASADPKLAEHPKVREALSR
jgi:tetratricopeptide (TPR) repeat protein